MPTFFGDQDTAGDGSRANPRDDGNDPDLNPEIDNYYWFNTGVGGAGGANMLTATPFNPRDSLETDILYMQREVGTGTGWNDLERSNSFTGDEDQIRKNTAGGDATTGSDATDEIYRIIEFATVKVLVTYKDGSSASVNMQAMRLAVHGDSPSQSLHGKWLIRPVDQSTGFDAIRPLKKVASFDITQVTNDNPTSITGNAFDDGLLLTCYTAGTMIKTARGLVPVEEIVTGDQVYAVGKGLLPVIWASKTATRAKGPGRGVFIPKGLFGLDRDTTVSLQHGMLLEENGKEYLVPAKWLADEGWGGCHFIDDGSDIEYYHVLLPQHAVIEANRAKSESFYPGVEVLKHLSDNTKDQIFAAIPGLDNCLSDEEIRDAYGPRARPVLGMKGVLRDKTPAQTDGVIAA